MNRRTWLVTVPIAVAGSRAMASDNWLTTLALHAVTVTDGAVCELEPDPCE
ncbi:MAG: hypothetical protein PVF43_13660 [Candidatus Eiseniibacteriota bacterium]|jgi:hypothetical protein